MTSTHIGRSKTIAVVNPHLGESVSGLQNSNEVHREQLELVRVAKNGVPEIAPNEATVL